MLRKVNENKVIKKNKRKKNPRPSVLHENFEQTTWVIFHIVNDKKFKINSLIHQKVGMAANQYFWQEIQMSTLFNKASYCDNKKLKNIANLKD